MTPTMRKYASSTLILAMASAFAANADAVVPPRRIQAFVGNPLDGTPLSCFAENAGAVQGTAAAGCRDAPAHKPRWEVNLMIDRTGNFDVSIFAKGTATIPTCCKVYRTDANGTLHSDGPQKCAISSQTFTALNFPATDTGAPNANVPADAQLYVACSDLAQSFNSIGAITWSN